MGEQHLLLFFHHGLQGLDNFLVLMRASAVKPRAEHRDNFKDVLRQFFFERWRLALMDDDNFEDLKGAAGR